MSSQNEVSLSRQTIIRILSATTFLLLVASTTGQIASHAFGHSNAYGFVPLFYVDQEGNIPTFFSASLWLCASLLIGLIARLKIKSNDSRWLSWIILSLAMLYMAIDEASGIHELLQTPARWLLGRHASGVLSQAWVIFGITFVLAFALFYLRFFFSLPSRARKQFFAAAVIFLSGGLGMELVESYYLGTYRTRDFLHAMIVTVEEGLEMAGVIVFINALLHYIIEHHDIRLRLYHGRQVRS